jgi:hypothetical protein
MADRTFGELLRKWRGKKLSQRKLDELLGRARGITNNIENLGTRPSTDREFCETLGRALGVPAHVVYEAACRDHLWRLEPGLREWIEDRFRVAARTESGDPISIEKLEFLEYLDWLDRLAPDPEGLPLIQSILRILRTLTASSEDWGRSVTDDGKELVACIRGIGNLPAHSQRGLIRIFLATYDVAVKIHNSEPSD